MHSAAWDSELPGTGSSSLVSPRVTVSLGMDESSKCPAPKLLFLSLAVTEKNKQSFPHLTPEKDSQASSPGSCVILPCISAAQCCGLLDSSGDTHTEHPCSLGLGKHSAFTTQRSSVLLPPREASSLCFT